VRPTSVYGPGDIRGWLKLYQMVSRGWFLMIGDGKTLNHPVYVENLVDLFELAGTVPAAKGRTYLAGDDEPVTLTDLVRGVGAAVGSNVRLIRFPWYQAAWLAASGIEGVSKTLGLRPQVFRRRLSWFKTNRAFRIDRARKELGYQPRVRLSEGLARTAAWYRSAGYLSTDSSRPASQVASTPAAPHAGRGTSGSTAR
jgi:nucleoside-diphosphate-sugar epimerase